MVCKDIVDTKNNRLQNVLDERRLNMASAARKANVSVEVIRKIRDGKTVRRDKFFAVVHSLDVQPDEIIPNWDDNNR